MFTDNMIYCLSEIFLKELSREKGNSSPCIEKESFQKKREIQDDFSPHIFHIVHVAPSQLNITLFAGYTIRGTCATFFWLEIYFLNLFFSYDPMYEQEKSPILVVKSSFILNFKK